MKESFELTGGQINCKILKANLYLSWKNIFSNNAKVLDLLKLNNLRGAIDEIRETHFKVKENGELEELLTRGFILNSDKQIIQKSTHYPNGFFTKTIYNDYISQKEVKIESVNRNGKTETKEIRNYDKFNNLLSIENNFKNKQNELLSNQSKYKWLNSKCYLAEHNARSTKIKYHIGDRGEINTKNTWLNNKYEKYNEIIDYDFYGNIIKYQKSDVHKSSKTEREIKVDSIIDDSNKIVESQIYEETKNSEGRKIINKSKKIYTYDKNGLLANYKIINQNQNDLVITSENLEYDPFFNPISWSNKYWNYEFSYEYDKNNNWIKKVVNKRNKDNSRAITDIFERKIIYSDVT